MKREYHKSYSSSLQRDMELLVFGHAGTPVLFFPARMGRFYDYENWHVIEAVRDKIEQGHIQIFCVDSTDSETFYCDSCLPQEKIERYLQYEQYILQDVIPFMQGKNLDALMVSAGCSLGAYHAVNFAFRHPSFFSKVVGMSGRYDLTQPVSYFSDLLQGYWNESVYFNMPNQFIPGITNPELLQSLQKMEVLLAIGYEDPFLNSNLFLNQALQEKGIPNYLFIWDGEAHKACYWREMVKFNL